MAPAGVPLPPAGGAWGIGVLVGIYIVGAHFSQKFFGGSVDTFVVRWYN